jgi:hypothetical protein
MAGAVSAGQDPIEDIATRSQPMRVRRLLRENGLSLVLFGFFLLSVLGQVSFGLAAYNSERFERGLGTVGWDAYLLSGHFLEALFENWESEFLQMGLFVWLSTRLLQKGSAESKPLDEPLPADEDPRLHGSDPDAPWPVRRGGLVLWLYERSLAIAFASFFVVSFSLHAWGGLLHENEERVSHGLPEQHWDEFITSSQFWFQSFQNWQSEFLAILSIVILTIFLRQRGSPQSKAVAAAHSETGD